MSETLLDLSGIRTGYGRIEALHGLDVTIAKGETVALVGAAVFLAAFTADLLGRAIAFAAREKANAPAGEDAE